MFDKKIFEIEKKLRLYEFKGRNEKMKKAIVLGGSNGIGLAISLNLLKRKYHVIVVDRSEPKDEYFEGKEFTYLKCDLRDFDISLFEELSKDEEIELLMITAGFGRVSRFENLDLTEIKNQMQVNAVSIMEIIKVFYSKILSKKSFYTGVMVSIAGRISSPLFSTYSASKAALSKFIEALNIELEKGNTSNRILEVSPGSLKGTRFNGGKNDLSQTKEIAEDIVNRVLKSESLFIPEYEDVYKNVIERYQTDSRKFGLESYDYKISKNREDNKKHTIVGYMSGTFDLFHVGHLNLIKRAKAECDYLIVGVHPSAAHKGKETFIPFEERKAMVACCKYVDKVVNSTPEDSDSWPLYHYDKLFVGSDYKGTERFKKYEEYFADKGVKIVYFPYTKSTSSTQIRSLIMQKTGMDNLKRE